MFFLLCRHHQEEPIPISSRKVKEGKSKKYQEIKKEKKKKKK